MPPTGSPYRKRRRGGPGVGTQRSVINLAAPSFMLLLTIKPDNLRRPMLARGLEDPPPVFLHYGLCCILAQAGIDQSRRDVGVAQGILDAVEIDPALREPASDRPAQIV